ncbi:response regulator [Noviherbaspirillum sp. UKPF54]|uniref:response regulator n=1 Tax=Noviherbaspirillum sp. UKPF54 TaxID=2601898 RepID=UPI00143DA5F4|nr:response regulator [Noviherbaspirillum sp. UKPF54]
MNQTPQQQEPQVASRRFVLEMLGFSETEKALLASTFRLTGRRAFCYAEPDGPAERSDVYLVNADNPSGLQQMEARAPNAYAPALLIGRAPEDSPWPAVEKPIRWMKLFEQLDQAMLAALSMRASRPAPNGGQWNGTDFRRAADRHRPQPELIAPPPAESVLVVDDSATVRAFMRTRLAPFRFDVDYAENGEAAVAMAQAKRYTCIFLDVVMPGMDGYQVCKRIKSDPATRGTAVVMLSSKSSPFDKFRGSWAGCDAYLGKPVGEDELLATIGRFQPSARRVALSILSRG